LVSKNIYVPSVCLVQQFGTAFLHISETLDSYSTRSDDISKRTILHYQLSGDTLAL